MLASVAIAHTCIRVRVRMRKTLHACADDLGIRLGDGVYVACIGPSFETPAEIRAFGCVFPSDLVVVKPPSVRCLSEYSVDRSPFRDRFYRPDRADYWAPTSSECRPLEK